MEQGDFVCFRTGFDQVLLEFDRKPDESVHDICAVLDGRDARLQQWVTDSGVVALISDNYAVESVPSRPCDEHADHCASLPLHAHCLFRLGVYLGEIWYLSELADWLRAQQAQPLPAHRAAAAAARRGRLARDAGRDGLNLRSARATNGGAARGAEGSRMAERGLSGWQIVTLIIACVAVIAISAVALIIGKDALIAIAVILVLSVAVVSYAPLPLIRHIPRLATHRGAA